MTADRLTPTRAVLTVAGSAVAFSLIGGSVGYLLGRFAPGYYRSVFEGGGSPDFDPVQVGLGQGITQGLAGGVAVGLIIVALAELRRWREGPERPPVSAGGGADVDLQPAATAERPDGEGIRRIRLGALAGMVLGVPLLWAVPGYLWALEQWLKPGPPAEIERSAMAMSVLGLLVLAVLFGPLIGGAVGAAWVASRLGFRDAAAKWCVTCGGAAAVGVTALDLFSGDAAEQIGMATLPWRGGHLLWALLLIGWGCAGFRALMRDLLSSGCRSSWTE